MANPKIVEVTDQNFDLEVLKSRGRRWLRVHLGKDVKSDLKKLADAVEKALT